MRGCLPVITLKFDDARSYLSKYSFQGSFCFKVRGTNMFWWVSIDLTGEVFLDFQAWAMGTIPLVSGLCNSFERPKFIYDDVSVFS